MGVLFFRRSVAAGAAALALSCISCSSTPSSRTKSADTRILTSAEIQHAGYSDAYTTIQSLRPLWLRPRGTTSFRGGSAVKVYLDDSLLGGPEYLKQIAVSSISSIRFVDGLDASNRWGLDHGMGAIVVLTR